MQVNAKVSGAEWEELLPCSQMCTTAVFCSLTSIKIRSCVVTCCRFQAAGLSGLYDDVLLCHSVIPLTVHLYSSRPFCFIAWLLCFSMYHPIRSLLHGTCTCEAYMQVAA